MWQRKQGNLQSGVGQGLRYITICKCIKLVYTIPTFLDLEKYILMESECDYVYAVAVGAGKLAVAWNETGVKIYNYM